MKSLSSNNPIGFGLEKSGVWEKINWFFENLPAGATVYWVTFSIGPGEKYLKKIGELEQQRDFKLKVICRIPLIDNGPSLSEKAFNRLQKNKDLFVDGKIRAYSKSQAGFADVDESLPGQLHAKFIVAETEKDTAHPFLVTGSFNFAHRSLCDNTESIFISDDASEARKALEAARMLDELSEDLTKKHCGGRKGTGEEAGRIENPPKGGESRPLSPVAQPEIINKPEDLKKLAEKLDELLQNYPNKGDHRQYDIYRSLEKSAGTGRRKDLLYLPVGVGKTFIALRWLVYHLHNAFEHSRNSGTFAVYLTPNEWVKITISSALDDVAGKAGVDLQQVSGLIKVVKPGDASEFPSSFKPAAVVADECQNWNPADKKRWKSGRYPTYTRVLNRFRVGNTPILGLSATPCRMQEMKFNPKTFIEKFIDNTLTENEDRPYMQLKEAISDGFICRPEYEMLMDDSVIKEVNEILTNDDSHNLIGFGEYSQATLRDVWRVISENPHELVKAILKAFKDHDTRRAVIFLPPVEEEADEFVDILRKELRKNGNSRAISRNNLFDFRSSAASGAAGTSVFSEFQNAKSGSDPYPPVLLTIDRFQEGVSIKDIDMLVMLRATLSPRVAMQALGRGLRLSEGKSKCMVLNAVMFEERVNQWEESIQANETPPDEKDKPVKKPARGKKSGSQGCNFRKLGNRTIASIREDEEAKECLKSLFADATVHTYLNKSGKYLVCNLFKEFQKRVDELPQNKRKRGKAKAKPKKQSKKRAKKGSARKGSLTRRRKTRKRR